MQNPKRDAPTNLGGRRTNGGGSFLPSIDDANAHKTIEDWCSCIATTCYYCFVYHFGVVPVSTVHGGVRRWSYNLPQQLKEATARSFLFVVARSRGLLLVETGTPVEILYPTNGTSSTTTGSSTGRVLVPALYY